MSAEAYVVCTSCGRKLAARFDACVYCGGPVADPSARAAPASVPPPGPWKARESTPPPAAPAARASTRPPAGAGRGSGLELAEVERHPRRESERPPGGPVGMAPVHRSAPPPPGVSRRARSTPGWLVPVLLGVGALLVVLAVILFVRPGLLLSDPPR
ncbi:MAG: hypothetical protein IT373_27665 [Polyangiaceae bacterium]|nr:hypothetical protein [Polyangiaceae bacterium]